MTGLIPDIPSPGAILAQINATRAEPMLTIPAGRTLPDNITPSIAWGAFNETFRILDWSFTITSTTPLLIDVEQGPDFRDALDGARSSSPMKQAGAWVAERVLEASRSLTKAQLRRLSLQVPRAPDHPSAALFQDGLKRRVEFAVRDEITRHLDRSIPDWETKALDYVTRCNDPLKRDAFWTYAGFDQLVSDDAARKSIKFLAHRTHWYLQGEDNNLELVPDWRFQKIVPRRNAEEETMRARSLVARAIEGIFADNSRRRLTRQPLAPVSREAIMDTILKRFDQEGPWGLVHLVLDSDRARYGLERPIDPIATELLEQQRPRLFRVWAPEKDGW